ncbi:MAG: sensor histidine kinase, partial [Nitrospinota bacterium]|nr:sensor histidine kinase [Nitrospinota bacterium]
SNMVRNSVEAQATRIRIGLRLEKDSAIYYVSDNGSGMAPETLNKMMDPFYTTKSKGYGLGLSFVNSVARSHGGRAIGENLPDGGALFRMYIPRAGADKQAARSKSMYAVSSGLEL